MKIERTYVHRDYGKIGEAHLNVGLTDEGKLDIMLNENPLPPASIEYLLKFSLQCLQDAYAGATSTNEAQGSFNKKLDAIIAGKVGHRGNAVDPAVKMARQTMMAAAKTKWTKEKFAEKLGADVPATERNALLDKILKNNPQVLEDARKTIEAQKRAVEKLDVEL